MRAPWRALAAALPATVMFMLALWTVGCTARTPAAEDARPALRVLRLAGFDDAGVGADGSLALARMALPASSGAADAELAWQTAFAALSVAYPHSRRYAVIFEAGDRARIEVSARGGEVRAAVKEDDPASLRRAATFAFSSDADETDAFRMEELPASSSSIDAENRAEGLVTSSGLDVAAISTLEDAWRTARASAPGVPAVEGGPAVAARAAASRIDAALRAETAPKIDNEKALIDRVAEFVGGAAVPELRLLASITEAIASPEPLGSVVASTADVARQVRAASGGKPASRPVRAFERTAAEDATGTPVGERLPNEVLARVGTAQSDGTYAITWNDGGGTARSAAPVTWLAYRGPHGFLYWLAGEDGEVALADVSIPGWAWPRRAAELVDADDVTRTLMKIPLR